MDRAAENSQVDVEQIVREVMKRLGSPSPIERPAAAAQDEVMDRVIGLAELAGRIDGVRSVVARPGAVVTPAARDLLRERGVVLEFAAWGTSGSGEAERAARLVMGVAEATAASATLGSMLAREGVELEMLAWTGLVSVIDEMAREVVRGGRLGLLVTHETDAALCLANRLDGVRAVRGESVDGVRESLRSLAANLLVVACRGRTTFELQRIAREFCLGGPRACHEPYRERLESHHAHR